LGIDFKIALEIAREWRGSFETEVDLKMPVSTQDKAQAINEMEVSLANVFYARPFSSVDEIRIEIDALHKKAIMRELDDVYALDKLIQKAELIIAARQTAPEAMSAVPEVNQGQVNQDVARELSPQTELAQAGL
jgi:hypothetical protein